MIGSGPIPMPFHGADSQSAPFFYTHPPHPTPPKVKITRRRGFVGLGLSRGGAAEEAVHHCRIDAFHWVVHREAYFEAVVVTDHE